jgi:hypothetical protein
MSPGSSTTFIIRSLSGDPVAEKSSLVAKFALAVSIGAAAFSVYQWWSSGRYERIRAAIEISNKFIDQVVDADYTVNLYRAGERGPEIHTEIGKHYARLEYIAYLGNVGLINVNYLSQFLICSIVYMPVSLERNKEQIKLVIPSAEASKFRPPKTISCPPPKRD